MYVTKRDGRKEPVRFDKITLRIRKQAVGLSSVISPEMVASKVIAGIFDGVSSRQLDELAAETAAGMVTEHVDYSSLAARLWATAHHKEVPASFARVVKRLHGYVNARTGDPSPLVSHELTEIVRRHGAELDAMLDHEQDFQYDYFGYRTLYKGYLLKLPDAQGVFRPAERVQHMLMRVAVGLWGDNLTEVARTYRLMSERYYTHATPTLFNAGTPTPQLSSCFLLEIDSDSIGGIYKTLGDVAQISKTAGGIGVHAHHIRAKGAYIKGTNGTSDGLIPMLRVFNETARYVNQSGKRKGSIAVYLEPWHADVEDFLELRKNHGAEHERARDLFLALWTPDLFVRRVMAGETWTLFSPDEAPGLADAYGDAFETLYVQYEREGRGRKTLPARDLYERIKNAQIETGTPYILFKDAVNRKTNHQHLGTIKSSNLCAEILEYTAPDEIAVCNLGSLALPRFLRERHVRVEYGVTDENQRVPIGTVTETYFDYQALYEVAHQATKNLDRVIDVNFYPVPEAEHSNRRHRPIGLGVQGLADVFAQIGLAYDSAEALQMDRDIHETMYFAALSASCDLAEEVGPYPTYAGSPVSRGILQFDQWTDRTITLTGGTPRVVTETPVVLSGRWDWDALRARIWEHGVRNSLLIALMPTASTAQILGNTESFEPFTANIYVRRVLNGEFVVVNRHLVRDLEATGLWSRQMGERIVAAKGSVQDITEISPELRARYKTVWELPSRVTLDHAAARGPFICQTQSMNIYLAKTARLDTSLTSAFLYAWAKGLKTGMYYLRSRPGVDALAGLGLDTSANQKPVSVTISSGGGLTIGAVVAESVPAADDTDCLMCSA